MNESRSRSTSLLGVSLQRLMLPVGSALIKKTTLSETHSCECFSCFLKVLQNSKPTSAWAKRNIYCYYNQAFSTFLSAQGAKQTAPCFHQIIFFCPIQQCFTKMTHRFHWESLKSPWMREPAGTNTSLVDCAVPEPLLLSSPCLSNKSCVCCKCSTIMHLYYWFLSFHWLLELHSNSEALALEQQRTKSRPSVVWGVVTAAAHIHEHAAPPMFSLIPVLSCMKQHLLGSCGPVFLWMSPTHNPLPCALDLCLPPSLWCSPFSCCSSSVHPQRRLSPKTKQLICTASSSR